jgi:hypothetical protein
MRNAHGRYREKCSSHENAMLVRPLKMRPTAAARARHSKLPVSHPSAPYGQTKQGRGGAIDDDAVMMVIILPI